MGAVNGHRGSARGARSLVWRNGEKRRGNALVIAAISSFLLFFLFSRVRLLFTSFVLGTAKRLHRWQTIRNFFVTN